MQRQAARQRLDALVSRYQLQRQRLDADPALGDHVRELAAFQAARLATTYEDLARQPRYRAAIEFFLSDLYGPQDLAERDRQILRALEKLKRLLPAAALDALARAFELHVLTIELDTATAAALPAATAIESRTYAAAYRAAGRQVDRERQIRLIGEIGSLLDSLAHRPEIALAIHLARHPARAAGYGQLQDFIERGCDAFRQLAGAGPFLDEIATRETALMQRLFAGADK